MTSAARIVQAARFAAEKHKDPRRKDADASPYINHPLAVASVLEVSDDKRLAKALRKEAQVSVRRNGPLRTSAQTFKAQCEN